MSLDFFVSASIRTQQCPVYKHCASNMLHHTTIRFGLFTLYRLFTHYFRSPIISPAAETSIAIADMTSDLL
jgi:hypothetical protein